MISSWKRVVLLYLILISINGCGSMQQTVKTPPAPLVITASPTLSMEVRQPTTTPTIMSSTVPFRPTLSATEAETRLLELLNDHDCRLPCFLGIVPGKTDQLQAISTLHQFDEISDGTEIKFSRGDLIVSLDFIAQNGYSKDHPEIVKWTEANMLVYHQLDSNIQKNYQSPYYSEYFQNYTLPYLLSTYGPPENAYIFLDTGIAEMGLGIDLYLLHLDYSDKGWVAHLEMPLLVEGSFFLGCPSEAFTMLRLWSPHNPARDYDLGPKVLFTLQEATGLTLEEFYQKFKDPANTACLETPANIHK